MEYAKFKKRPPSWNFAIYMGSMRNYMLPRRFAARYAPDYTEHKVTYMYIIYVCLNAGHLSLSCSQCRSLYTFKYPSSFICYVHYSVAETTMESIVVIHLFVPNPYEIITLDIIIY